MTKLDLNRWIHGPSFLKHYKSDWKFPNERYHLSETDPEIKKDPIRICNSVNVNEILKSNPIVDIANYFSYWSKMKRIVGWLIKLADRCKHKTVLQDVLSVSELKRAETKLIRCAQDQSFSEEIDNLSIGRTVCKSSSLKDLNPFLDCDDVLRVRGRLKELTAMTSQPAIIPHDNPISVAIVRQFHAEAHVGVEWTFGLVRQYFWIVGTTLSAKVGSFMYPM